MARTKTITLETLSLILFFLSLSCLCKACKNQERETLLSFLSSLSTPIQSWNNITNSNCCNWEGITCDISSSITQLSLPYKGLTGEISPFISNLTNLSYLNLSHNSLSGPIPRELLSLSTSLTTLDLSFNSLTGPVQSTKGPLIQVLNLSSNFLNGSIPVINSTLLVSLNVSNNSLTSRIPASLCTLSPFLTMLDISYNSIIGNIPEEIGNCTLLQIFRAGHNDLTGALPVNLFKLSYLEQLHLSSNRIEGSLNEYPISRLTNLVRLDLDTNSINGFIPVSIGQLKSLQYLLLGSNNISGTIPAEIANCTGLKQLNLMVNNLTGDLQSINFTRLSSLTQLDLYNNHLTGEIPETIYACTELDAISISGNDFHGQISPEIRNLKSLTYLALSINNFKNLTGTLEVLSSCKNLTALLLGQSFFNETLPAEPNWETGFENIQIFSLGGCNLTGTIPSWILKMSKLSVLDLSNNQLTGPIPAWISTFSYLFCIDLSNNYLSGNIPQQITNLPSLDSDHEIMQLDTGLLELTIHLTYQYQYKLGVYTQLRAFPSVINLSNNSLHGTIPLQIGRLVMLQLLQLSGNSITGVMPDQLGNITNLEILDLSRNNLTGRIPASLNQLHFLATFSVAFNELEGPVLIGGQFDTFSNLSYEGNPNLCGGVLVNQPCHSPSTGENNPSLSSNGRSKVVIIALTLGIFFGAVLIVLVCAISFVVASEGKV